MLINIAYNMPNWVLALCIFVIISVVGLIGLFLVNKYYTSPSRENNDLVATLAKVAGILFAVVIGFIAITVINAFNTSVLSVENEANEVFTIWINSRVYPEKFERQVHQGVEKYLNLVIHEEWPLQSQGQVSLSTEQALESLYRLLIDYVPTSQAQQQVHNTIINKVSNAFINRKDRLFTNLHGVSKAVYSMICLSILIILCYVWSMATPSFPLHCILTCLLSIGIGVVVFLIVCFDYPFRGEISVGPEAFEKVLAHIQRLKIEQPLSPGI